MPPDFFVKRKHHVYDIPVNVPRYLELKEKTLLTFRNISIDFYSKDYYSKGTWKFIIKQHGEGFYLEKEKLYVAVAY